MHEYLPSHSHNGAALGIENIRFKVTVEHDAWLRFCSGTKRIEIFYKRAPDANSLPTRVQNTDAELAIVVNLPNGQASESKLVDRQETSSW